MKAFTDLEQSKKLAEILPLESADMYYFLDPTPAGNIYHLTVQRVDVGIKNLPHYDEGDVPCWSLAALLEYMNRNFYNISLNYCGSEYTISFDDSERYKTITKNYSIDAAFEMVIWLKENNRL